MVAAAGSGELLFTPIIASQHGYALLWALLAAVTLKWFINREIGRYSVCTGETILQGFRHTGKWAVWLIVVPQAFVAATALAGLASAAATALTVLFPGSLAIWTTVILVVSMLLVVFGRYSKVELVARIEAAALGIAAIIAAAAVLPGAGPVLRGLRPQIPHDADYAEVLPWLAYLLAGAAGLMWYSYWVVEKRYGVASAPHERNAFPPEQLRGWLTQMTLDTTVAVVGATIITTAFLILGAELLQPRGLVPEESRVAETLGRLFQEFWGRAGFWFMVVSVLSGLWVTVLSNQDGFARLLTDGFLILRGGTGGGRWGDRGFVQRACTVVLLTAVPTLLFWIFGKPIGLLKVAGAIEAAHIPVVTLLVLQLNHREIARELQPGRAVFVLTAAAGLFFTVFAVIYTYQLVSGRA